ncbi:DUF3160 domain-containing protein [Candidatus Uabimicrobium sp. HlEnr_7]|uniref:DUF3160 domain-containing protein n=1 Tax=Candidatus Uabimicrobium helgolandensis TaxID=3095367 RepID=UPI0035580952
MKSWIIVVVIFILSCTTSLIREEDGSIAKEEISQEKAKFDQLLKKYQANEPQTNNQQMVEKFSAPEYRQKLSFKGKDSKYFTQIAKELRLGGAEKEQLDKNGFVTLPSRKNTTFVSIYYDIYQKHLPLFITSDSILYAFQRSYGTMLKQLESQLFKTIILSTLKESQLLLKEKSVDVTNNLLQHYKDVDLYLTVAQNLFLESDESTLKVPPVVASPVKVKEILSFISKLKMQVAGRSESTAIYGGTRYIDYSQFRPRGHYTEQGLQGYFRGMMWLGRADCGMILSSAKGVKVDIERELRNAMLISKLFSQTKAWQSFTLVDTILTYLVGQSDNLKINTMISLLQDHKIQSLSDTRTDRWIAFREDVAQLSQQGINSQYIKSDSKTTKQAEHPQLFQVFGQRFVIDSFILSSVVYDKIVFQEKKQKRRIPKGLDVMAILGNSEAARLLQPEIDKWNYTANILALNELIEGFDKEYWQKSCYNNMLDNLRILDKDVTKDSRYPQAMQSQIWQKKQLTTQLATWAEMRHNNILYAKQSYTASISCEYPEGYVEPYPEFYKRLGEYCSNLDSLLTQTAKFIDKDHHHITTAQSRYFNHFSQTMKTLEQIANKQLDSQPLDEKQQSFLKKTVEKAFLGCGGPPSYDGWYCKLYYAQDYDWKPSIADIHTDPNSQSFLEVATGNAQYSAIVIDNENDLCSYVGPVFSYYEFTSKKRLQDEEWRELLRSETFEEKKYQPEWIGNTE